MDIQYLHNNYTNIQHLYIKEIRRLDYYLLSKLFLKKKIVYDENLNFFLIQLWLLSLLLLLFFEHLRDINYL